MAKKTPSADDREFWIRERCYIRELVNDASIGAFSLAEARVEPGVRTELHRLSVDEWYVIKAGQGRMSVGEAEQVPVGVDLARPGLLSRRPHSGSISSSCLYSTGYAINPAAARALRTVRSRPGGPAAEKKR